MSVVQAFYGVHTHWEVVCGSVCTVKLQCLTYRLNVEGDITYIRCMSIFMLPYDNICNQMDTTSRDLHKFDSRFPGPHGPPALHFSSPPISLPSRSAAGVTQLQLRPESCGRGFDEPCLAEPF